MCEWRRKKVIVEAKAGIVGKNISIESLVEVCKKFFKLKDVERKQFGINALSYGENQFNRERLLIQLENYMEEMKNE